MGDDTTEGQTRDAAPRRPYFGRRLKELRESYVMRTAAEGVQRPLVRAPSTQRLVQCLREQNVAISAAAYNEIELGVNVPRNARAFLEGVTKCLELIPDEAEELKWRLAYDILWARLGKLADDIVPKHSQWEPPPPDW